MVKPCLMPKATGTSFLVFGLVPLLGRVVKQPVESQPIENPPEMAEKTPGLIISTGLRNCAGPASGTPEQSDIHWYKLGLFRRITMILAVGVLVWCETKRVMLNQHLWKVFASRCWMLCNFEHFDVGSCKSEVVSATIFHGYVTHLECRSLRA